MSKFTMWIADQMLEVSEKLTKMADKLYDSEFLMDDARRAVFVNENYNFDDDETGRTSDTEYELGLPDADAPNYEADNEPSVILEWSKWSGRPEQVEPLTDEDGR